MKIRKCYRGGVVVSLFLAFVCLNANAQNEKNEDTQLPSPIEANSIITDPSRYAM